MSPSSRRVVVLLASCVSLLTLAGLALVGLPARPASASTPAPWVVPALRSWTPSDGSSFTFTASSRVVASDRGLEQTARTFASDLSVLTGRPVPTALNLPGPPAAADGGRRPGDIVLVLDQTVRPAGEGYTLSIGSRVQIAGATNTGVFWGTRTVLQLLRQSRTLPAGSARDWPSYGYRGISLCNCVKYFSVPWLERLIQDMSYLKLNQLHLEMRIVSRVHPENNPSTGPLYTPAQAAQIVAYGERYHVQVVQQVNSPGHMDYYLAAHKSLQVTDSSRVANPSDIDMANPSALPYVQSLIAEQIGQFPGSLWYGGGDEYLGAAADYENYPSLVSWVHQLAGANAPAADAWVLWQNQIDQYIRTRYHRTLHVWNDQIYTGMPTALNKDVIVDYWIHQTGRLTPTDLSADGYDLVNVSDSLYYVSDPPAAQWVYETWTPNLFTGGLTIPADDPHLLGAAMAIWPSAHAQSEEVTEQALSAPMHALAQNLWGSPKLAGTYAGFQPIEQAVGDAPTATTIGALTPDRVVTLRAANGTSADVTGTDSEYGTVTTGTQRSGWLLREDGHGLYTLVSATDGRCLAVSGDSYDNGAAIVTAACAASDVPDDQQWAAEQVPGGFILRSDSSGQVLTAGTHTVTQAYDMGVPQAVLNLPGPPAAAQVWRLGPASSGLIATMATSAPVLAANGSVTATVTVANWGSRPATDVAVPLKAPSDITATPVTGTTIATLAPGASGMLSWTLAAAPSVPDDLAVPHASVSGPAGTPGASATVLTTAANLAGLRAWDADFTSNTVTATSLSTLTTDPAIAVGTLPGTLTSDPSGQHVYTVNQGDASVSVIDAAADKVTATIAVGSTPAGLWLSPDNKTLWISAYGDNAIQPVDLTAGTAGKEIPVAAGPEDLQVSPDGKTIWVACKLAEEVDEVSVASGSVIARLPVSGGPDGIAITPDGKTVYVSQEDSDTVLPITASTATAGTPIVTGPGPFNITVSPDGKTLGVPLNNEFSMVFVSTATNKIIGKVLTGPGPTSVAFSPDSAMAYAGVGNEDLLVPILLSGMRAGPAVSTGGYPIGVTIAK